MFLTQIENEPYARHYREGLQHRAQAIGYDFGECPPKAVRLCSSILDPFGGTRSTAHSD